MYPGDPGGDPGEVYNCRCTMISVLPETEKKCLNMTHILTGLIQNMKKNSWHQKMENGRKQSQ